MSDENNNIKLVTLVPEVYYNLIAWVSPGTFLIVVIIWIFHFDKSLEFLTRKEINWAVITGFLIFLLGAGNIVGILISPLGDWLHRKTYRYCIWKEFSKRKENENLLSYLDKEYNLGGYPDPTKDCWEDEDKKKIDLFDRLAHDLVKQLDPQAKVIIPKIQAEAALCNNLLAASLILLVILIPLIIIRVFVNYYCTQQFLDACIPLFLCIVLALFSYFAGKHRGKRLISREFSFLRLCIGIV